MRTADRLLERREVGRALDQHVKRVACRGGGSSAAHKYPSSGGVRCAERPSLPSRRAW